MKICMLSAFYHPLTAGSEVFTKEISERLVDDGHEVHVVTGLWAKGLRKTEEVEGVHVHRVPSILIQNLALPSVVPGMLMKGLQLSKDCDLIHAHLAFPPGFVGAKIKLLTGKPLITTVQGGDMGIYPQSGLGRFFPLVKPCVRWALKSSDRVTAISDFLAQKARGLGARDVVLVRNGTDTESFNPKVPFDSLKKKYDIGGAPIIMTVSRLVPKNGTDTLISAFSEIKRAYPKSMLVIAGDGPQRAALETQAKGMRLDDSILFLGYVPHEETPGLMNMADVFVRVSLEEGLGIVFTEAMACKSPVVGTNVGGIPDIIKSGETGMLVPPADPDATARAISNILSDPKLRKSLALKGYEAIRKEFSWDSIYKKMSQLYSELADQ